MCQSVGTPAYIVIEAKGTRACLWLKHWIKITEKEGCLAFPENYTFNLRILENLRQVMYGLRTPPRPAQFEALAIWELAARQQQSLKFEKKMRRAEKSSVEARWDSEQRQRRLNTLLGVRLFPEMTEDGEKVSKKSKRSSSAVEEQTSKEPKEKVEGKSDGDADQGCTDRDSGKLSASAAAGKWHVSESRIHASHTQKVNNPTEQEEELLGLLAPKRIPGQEREREELEATPGNAQVSLPIPESDEVEGIREEEGESSSTETVKEPVQRQQERVPVQRKPSQRRGSSEADGLTNQIEQVTDPHGKGVETDPSQEGLTPPEPVVRTLKHKSLSSILKRA
ncbi:hypothetical protein NDU88_005302 [Pleurodeles waltl]|uniref:Uncharacterized protein n=1 Tax=Pleurodeles waltl TaxID=8319 RepID=A0AAV7WY99_PLEWA|nr:hypothetical protein NDU88_005302 [Pleurodeles waltl]